MEWKSPGGAGTSTAFETQRSQFEMFTSELSVLSDPFLCLS